MAAWCKFDQLRIKTDTELIQLITHELKQGLQAAATQSYSEAERAYDAAAGLIRITEIAQEERSRLESKLEQLRDELGPHRQPGLVDCLVS